MLLRCDCARSRLPVLALFGPGAMSDLSSECAPKRTPAKRCSRSLWVHALKDGLNCKFSACNANEGRKIVRIAVIGGGPGGLYFAYLWKRRHPDADIDLFEQNAAGATWGFGVVFSEQALEFLRTDDSDTVDAIAPRMESWRNITLNLRGESVEIDGVGFSSIGRLELLRILQERASSVGVTPRYDTLLQSADQLTGYDL